MSLVRGMATTAMQFAAAMSAGDVLGQGLERYVEGESADDVREILKTIDWSRTARMGATGLFVNGPWSHAQYYALNRLFPGNCNLTVAKKVASGIVLAPIGISLMFSSVLALKGEHSDIADKLAKDGIPTWGANSIYWPAIMTLNFKYVPEARQPSAAALAAILWNAFTSYQSNKASEQGEDDKKPASSNRA